MPGSSFMVKATMHRKLPSLAEAHLPNSLTVYYPANGGTNFEWKP